MAIVSTDGYGYAYMDFRCMMFELYDTKGEVSSIISTSRMRGSDPWVSRKSLAGHGGPARELPVSRGLCDRTRPGSVLSPLTRPDPTREIFKPFYDTRPYP